MTLWALPGHVYNLTTWAAWWSWAEASIGLPSLFLIGAALAVGYGALRPHRAPQISQEAEHSNWLALPKPTFAKGTVESIHTDRGEQSSLLFLTPLDGGEISARFNLGIWESEIMRLQPGDVVELSGYPERGAMSLRLLECRMERIEWHYRGDAPR